MPASPRQGFKLPRMGHSMKKFLLIGCGVVVVPPVLFVAFIVFYATFNSEALEEARRREAEGPTSSEDVFDKANRTITSSGGGHAYGNTETAIVMADQYSVMMKSMSDEMFSGGKQRAISLTDGKFLTYCQSNEDSCAFLVHVPQLRQYKGEVRDALSSIAWTVARAVAAESGLPEDARLGVGLRGTFLYGPVMVAPIATETTSTELKKDELYQFFPLAEAPVSTPENSVPDEVDVENAAETESDPTEPNTGESPDSVSESPANESSEPEDSTAAPEPTSTQEPVTPDDAESLQEARTQAPHAPSPLHGTKRSLGLLVA